METCFRLVSSFVRCFSARGKSRSVPDSRGILSRGFSSLRIREATLRLELRIEAQEFSFQAVRFRSTFSASFLRYSMDFDRRCLFETYQAENSGAEQPSSGREEQINCVFESKLRIGEANYILFTARALKLLPWSPYNCELRSARR